MRIGIGIPNTIPGTEGRLLLEWSRRADRLGFASLGTIGRVAYPGYDELIVLAAAAGTTERIELSTNVLLGPTRSPVLLAREAAALDQLSGGRLALGVGVGGRGDDFDVSGTTFRDRGRRWDQALELMHRAWRGEPVAGSTGPVSPRPVEGDRVPLLFGGMSDATMERVVRWGVGYVAGGGGADRAAPIYERVRAAWKAAGRPGEPQLRALAYFALGPDTDRGREYLVDYYGAMGDAMWPQVPRDPEALRETARQFEAIGASHLVLAPTIASIEQVDLLAEAVL
jgi:alkanesulfonate monooxygenase SsuD/methylene tetrahydromethanopterin reductase-like flavin-dependent oxidoreductase (luciferase family)